MERLMKCLFMFAVAVIMAMIAGPVFVGSNSVAGQNMTPGGMMAGNMTPGGMMAGNMTPGIMAGSEKMHLEEGIRALEFGNIQVAIMHLGLAKQTISNAPSDAVKHFEQGMKALNAGDSKSALEQLKLANHSLG